jgi:hypothetical protein
MKTRWRISMEIQGDYFRPSLLSIPFSDQHDTGAIGKFGKYRGLPTPYGAASYIVPHELLRPNLFKHLADVFEHRLDDLRKAGATSWHVSIARYYWAQCNEDYSAEDLEMLRKLKCGFTYSAYSITEEEEREIDAADE